MRQDDTLTLCSTFLMSIKSKLTKIGITTAHMSEMTVDMVGPGGVFGRLDIPPAKIGRTGADIIIADQVVQILDMTAFKAFVTSIMQDDELVLRLDNGHCTIKALGRTASIVYAKDIPLKGLKSLKVNVIQTEPEDGGYKNTMLMVNSSPFEIDLGTVQYEVLDEDGAVIAKQKGSSYISRGESKASVTGPITGKTSKSQVRFIGVDVDEDNWYKEIIKAVDITVGIPRESTAWRTS